MCFCQKSPLQEKYNNHCDYLDSRENELKIEVLSEIQELYKTRNSAESELNYFYEK